MKNTRIGKVYIVTWGFYDDSQIKDVFTTREAAETYIEEHVTFFPRTRDHYGIEEWEVKG